jgi:2,3-dihydroxybiphenyl 1,2-dioxygenase
MQLSYLHFEVSDLDAWSTFATTVLGLGVVEREDGLGLRMDGHAQRFFLTEGPADNLAAVGWEVDDVDVLSDRLRGAGIGVEPADGAARDAASRMVFRDPGGVRIEAVSGVKHGDPFVSELVPSGFVADELGLGHVVLTTRSREESEAFYRDLVGFSLSDHIRCEFYGYPVDLAFLHCNRRHHSLALGGRLEKNIHHFMIEARSIDDVGAAWERTLRAKIPIVNTLGRHPNDRMISFYAMTPSGFQFEFGTSGRLVDETWKPVVWDRVSEWGHHPPQALVPRRKK